MDYKDTKQAAEAKKYKIQNTPAWMTLYVEIISE